MNIFGLVAGWKSMCVYFVVFVLCKGDTCHLLEHSKYLDCSDRELNATTDLVPKSVAKVLKYLDLSGNKITKINLSLYGNLRTLLLKYNKISELDNVAMRDLTMLEEIDLRYNSMRTLKPDTFIYNSKLKKVILRGNVFANVGVSPILRSVSLEVLDLSTCFFPAVSDKSFSLLPSLKSLDISNNDARGLSQNTLMPMKHLEKINFLENWFMCDCRLNDFVDWASNRYIFLDPVSPLYCTVRGEKRTRKWDDVKETLNCTSKIVESTELTNQQYGDDVVFPEDDDSRTAHHVSATSLNASFIHKNKDIILAALGVLVFVLLVFVCVVLCVKHKKGQNAYGKLNKEYFGRIYCPPPSPPEKIVQRV